MDNKELTILSIDAWREGYYSWTWNNWFKIGTIDLESFEKLTTNRKKIKWLRDEGYINEYSKGNVTILDDGHNWVLEDKNTHEPIIAFEYGNIYY